VILTLERVLYAPYHVLLWALAGLGSALLLGYLIFWCLFKVFSRWARHTATPVDDAAIKHLGGPLRWLLPISTMLAVTPELSIAEHSRAVLHQVLVLLLTFSFGALCFAIVRVVEDVLTRRLQLAGADSPAARSGFTQIQGFRNIAGFVIAVLTVGVALLSFDSVRQVGASLLASAGVAGIVLGFAAQRSIAALIAGITLAIAQPIRINDAVVLEGEWGTIEEITLTYVVVRIWDLRRLVVPVNYFLEKPFQNWTRTSTSILATALLYVDYSVPLDVLRTELERVLKGSPFWDGKDWALEMTDTTERCVVLRSAMSAADAGTAWKLRCEVREKLVEFLQRDYPQALPRLRTDLNPALSAGDPEASLSRVITRSDSTTTLEAEAPLVRGRRDSV
jgi:small-conductance mechanosensitive channel